MATFDFTTVGSPTAWDSGVQTKSWTIDIADLKINKGLVTTDYVRLMAIPTGSGIQVICGNVYVNTLYAGTSCAIDLGINGGVEFTADYDCKVATGTRAALSTNAAAVLYSNTSGSTTYITAKIKLGATDTTAGKVTFTLTYQPLGPVA